MSTQEDTVISTTTDSPPQNKTVGGGFTVLLAEDDRALRRYLQIVLERAGYRVIPANDGLEAMKIALTVAVDLVITDGVMPNLDGYELCRFLRSAPKLTAIPIILLSALERKKEELEGTEAVEAFLAKPVSAEELTECVEKLLGCAVQV
jgi:CheY-like chemotaxis protein